MTNDLTARGFERPHPDNIAREDAGRVRRTIEKIDSQLTDLESREATETAVGNVRLATASEAEQGTATDSVPAVRRVMDMIARATGAFIASVNDLMEDLAQDYEEFTAAVTTTLNSKASKAANLSDLPDKGAARTALELGAAALKEIASVAALRAKTGADVISVDAAWDAAKWVELGAISGTVTIDASLGARFHGQLVGNVVIDVINLKNGQPLEFGLDQDGVGGRTVSWSSKFMWPSAAAPEISTAANSHAVIATGVARWDAGGVFMAGWKVTA